MKFTSLSVAILVGAISLSEAITIRQDADQAVTTDVVDADVFDADTADAATSDAVISETDVPDVPEPEITVDNTMVDETPTERATVQGDDSAVIEQVKSFGHEGDVYGTCSSVSHPFAKISDNVFEDVQGFWKTLFVDRGMFDKFYRPICMKIDFEKLYADDATDTTIVSHSIEVFVSDNFTTKYASQDPDLKK
jgi:hypothetical protein